MKRSFSPLLVLLLCCCLAIQSAAAALSAVNSASMEWLHSTQSFNTTANSSHQHHNSAEQTQEHQQAGHSDGNHRLITSNSAPSESPNSAMDCCECDCEANCVMGCHPATILHSIQLSFLDTKHFQHRLSTAVAKTDPQESLRPPIQH